MSYVSPIRPNVGIPANSQPPGGGGGGDEMNSRIAKLEAHAEHVETQLNDIKSDVRELRNWGMGAVGLIFAVLIAGYLLLSDKTEKVSDKLVQIELTLQQVADSVIKKTR
jgi:hypothetical protein